MFKASIHEISADFEGDPDAAFDLAKTSLVFQGFEIVAETDTELRAKGPGLHNNHQPPTFACGSSEERSPPERRLAVSRQCRPS